MEEVMDFSRRFERAFVELVGRRLEKQGWKKGEFAAKVWPDVDQRSAAVLWSSVCKAGKMVDRVTSRLPRRYALPMCWGKM